MALEDDTVENEQVEGEEQELEQPDEQVEGAESEEGSEEEGAEGEGSEAAADDEVVVTIGDEEPPQSESTPAPEWVRELRKGNREKDRQIRELREQVQSLQAKPVTPAEPLGEKPTLAGCDYDEDKYEKDLQDWHQRKQVQADAEAKKQSDAVAQQEAWNAELRRYEKAKGELKVKDFEDAESSVKDTFSEMQQSLILDGATNSAMVVYALGKNPKAAKELAAIKSPAKFVAAVARLEDKMKVTPRKAQTLPEAPVKGSAPVSGTIDSQLERLRADARRTGDYSKVSEFQRKVQAKKRA